MNAGRVQVSIELLEDFLCLSPKNRITGVNWNIADNLLELRVEGPDMPATLPGQRLQLVQPTYRTKSHELVVFQ